MSDENQQKSNFRLQIVIESCRNLLIADRKSSDPYVKIKLCKTGEDLHETKHLIQTLNPVYTTKEDNTYMLDISQKKLKDVNGLTFKIKDWDRIGSNDDIGHVNVSYDELLSISESTTGNVVKELKIVPPTKRSKEDAGYITIKFIVVPEQPIDDTRNSNGGNKKKPPLSPTRASRATMTQKTTANTVKPAGGAAGGDNDEVSVASDSISVDLAEDGSSMEITDTTITETEPPTVPPPAALPISVDELVIEIVSCTNLLIGDVMTKSSDPYVKVKLANSEHLDLHETKYITQTLNPTYTIDTNSTFYIGKTQTSGSSDSNASNIKNDFDTYGIELKVKDYDRVGTNDELGYVTVSAQSIYSKLGQTMELKLLPPHGKEKSKRFKDAGYVTIHCRHYNSNDPNDNELKQKFLSKFDNSVQPPSTTISSLLGMKEGNDSSSPFKDTYSELPLPSPSAFQHKNASHQDMSLKSMRLWDVRLPPVKKHMVSGYLVPTVQGNMGIMNKLVSKRRRITLEVYQTIENKAKAIQKEEETESGLGGGGGGKQEQRKSQLYQSLLKGISVGGEGMDAIVEDQEFELSESDEVILRILKAKRKTHVRGGSAGEESSNNSPTTEHEESDTQSVSTMGFEDGLTSVNQGQQGGGALLSASTNTTTSVVWNEKIRCPLMTMELLDVYNHNHSVDIQVGVAEDTVVQNIQFQSSQQLNSFVKCIKHLKLLIKQRAGRLAKEYASSSTTTPQKKTRKHTSGGVAAVSPPNNATARGMIDVSAATKKEKKSKKKKKKGGLFGFGFAERMTPKRWRGDGQDDDDDDSSDSDDVGDTTLPHLFGGGGSSTPRGSNDEESGMAIDLLIEIVSAKNLPVADIFSSDPYVVVRDGTKELHRTKVLYKNLNPIWTLDTGSLFLIRTTAVDFFLRSQQLVFAIEDYDGVSSNDLLGTVEVDKQQLLKGTGERVEFEVETNKRYDKKDDAHDPKQGGRSKMIVKPKDLKATLALRFRHATADDVEFLESYLTNTKWNRSGIYIEESNLPLRAHKAKVVQRMKRQGPNGVQYRVKPYPDPAREEQETKWLTKYELEKETLEPSHSWIESSSGGLGQVFIEILQCDDLPNMDTSATGRDKTDAFACIVFEDCAVNTDVINDTIHPKWLPWTQRAFIFNIMHPSSQLRVGILDYDTVGGISGGPETKHDKIGRVNIDISNLDPGSLYTLKYNLLSDTTLGEGNVINGTITVRLRVQWSNQRNALLAPLLPPNYDPCFVSVPNNREFSATRFAIEGKAKSKNTLLSKLLAYVEELQTYEAAIQHIEMAFFTVLFWRGHYPVVVRILSCSNAENSNGSLMQRCTRPVTILLPLHSVTAFLAGIFVTQNLNRLPAFLLFAAGWFFLATMEHVQNHPSPWVRSRNYSELLGILVFNRSHLFGRSAESIQAGANLRAVEEYQKMNEERKKQRQKEKETQEQLEAQIRQAEEEAQEEAEEVDITTKASGVVQYLNPLRPLLVPAVKILEQVCVLLRVGKSVVLWRDSYLAFWLTTACFLGSLALVWIPWGFLIIWTCRIAAWVFLGPWMKLVDIFYFRRRGYETVEEMSQMFEEKLKDRYKAVLETTLQRQQIRERALKLQALKKYMFGQHILRVPLLKEDLLWDDPLPSSVAVPFNPKKAPPINIVQRKWGQRLTGDMIPIREKNLVLEKARVANETSEGAETDSLLAIPEKGTGTYGAC